MRHDDSDSRSASEHRDAKPPGELVVSTPASWKVLDVRQLAEVASGQSPVHDQLAALGEGADRRISTLTKLAAETMRDVDVLFSAVSVPGEDGNVDLTTFTVAVPLETSSVTRESNVSAGTLSRRPDEASPFVANSTPGPDQNAVMLAAGPAFRRESFAIFDLGEPLPDLPVFSVEYALEVPQTDDVAVLTFTTVAPSDPDVLREQFAAIAATVTFV